MGRIGTALAVAGCGALLLAPGACGGDDEGAVPLTTATTDAEAPTTTAAPATTTTEAAPTATTTFAQADDPPPLVNTGEDFDAIVRSFGAFASWLTAHPDTDRLSLFVRSGSPAWDTFEPYYADLAANGWRSDGSSPSTIRETRVLQRPSDDIAIVYVLSDNPAYRIVDESDQVVQESPEELGVASAFELRRGGDGVWLLENRTVLGHA